MVVRLVADGLPRVMAQYTFHDRAAYERYVRETAPALRAEGIAGFPTARFERMVGEVV